MVGAHASVAGTGVLIGLRLARLDIHLIIGLPDLRQSARSTSEPLCTQARGLGHVQARRVLVVGPAPHAQSVVENRYSAFKASHDVSKSHTMSTLALWWIDVHPARRSLRRYHGADNSTGQGDPVALHEQCP
jgi:hypothetical protein